MFAIRTSKSAVRAFSGARNPTTRSYTTSSGQQARRYLPYGIAIGGAAAGALLLREGKVQEVHADAPKEVVRRVEWKEGNTLEVPKDVNRWEKAGVYAWGDNRGRVVAPDSNVPSIKTAQRMHCFDGMVLRDLKLGRVAGVAVDQNGDVLQWGVAYAPGISTPEFTLKGKNIRQVELSDDAVIALGKDGTIYNIPLSKQGQLEGKKPNESGWLGGSPSPISYRKINPPLGLNERVQDISAGKDHLLVLTSKGRVFTAAVSQTYPGRGQLGIKGLRWSTRPAGPYDMCHEVKLPTGAAAAVAAGAYHSVVLDKEGHVYTFGDNTSGQCGFDYDPELSFIQTPQMVTIPVDSIPNALPPSVRAVYAGGDNSFFLIDVFHKGEKIPHLEAVYACGKGIGGSLGNGKWTHIQGLPSKIKTLSGMKEFDEKLNRTVPIRIAYITTGTAHSAAVLANVTNGQKSIFGSEGSQDFGSDVYFWGHNEHHQLGTGKRNNLCEPKHILPLTIHKHALDKMAFAVDAYRLQVSPKVGMKANNGKTVQAEQKVFCGDGTSAVYCKV